MLLLCALAVTPALAQSIAGHVFEDQGYGGGSGRNFATAGGGVTGARVELYHSGGAYMCAVSTVAGGSYTLNAAAGCAITTSVGGVGYTVRVVNGSVVSGYSGGGTAGLVPVQTYRTNCTTACGAAPVAVTNYVGGQNPINVDPGNNTAGNVPANSQSITTVTLTNALNAASNIDFGFNFFTVVNNNASGQGSLAQFITNANALTGASAPSAVFMLYNGTSTAGVNNTYTNLLSTLNGGTGQGFIINMNGGTLPAFTAANGKIDASNEMTSLGISNPNTNSVGSNSQCGPSVASGTTKVGTSGTTLPAWTGTTIPAVEIQNCGDGQWHLNGSGETAKAMAFHQCTIYIGASNVTVQDNLVGVHADGTLSTAVSGNYGISLANGSGRLISHNYVRVNNSAIRNDGQGSTGDTYQYNEVTQPQTGQNNTFDGILLIGPASFSGDLVQYNYSHDLSGGGIEIGFSGTASMTNETISNNTVCSNGWNQTGSAPYTYNNASSERVNIAIWQVSQGSTVTIKNNVITNSSGVGILVENAYGFTISQNSIYQNGLTSNNLGAGIALYASCSNCDPNNFSTSSYAGVTPNTGTTSSSSPNFQMNYPVITTATYTGGKLHVKGYVGGSTNLTLANATVELFVANNTDNNQNGQIFLGDGLFVPHGEGQTYIATFKSDSQGLFDQTIASGSFPAGVTITAGSTSLTSTATDSATGSTSEFGPNLLVQASATTIQGYVYYDANHDGNLDTGESWQNGATVYAVLWDTTLNAQAKVGTSIIGAQAIAYGSSSDTGFFSFDNVAPGDTYQLFLTTVAPATGGVYASQPAVSIPSGWVMVNPNSATVTIATTASGPQVLLQSFGLYHGVKVSGRVFKDNGAGTGGVANDGHLNGTEPGMYNVSLTAKDSGAVLLSQASTDAAGNYTLWLPTSAVNPVTITLTQVGYYTATGFDAGSPATGGSYNTTTLVFSITVNWTYTAYTGVNFGFIQSGNIFSPNGQQQTVPGSIAIYAHQYSSITGGTVTFTEAAAQSQPNYFNEILYNDTSCTGNLAAATYLAWGTAVTIPAGGGKVCLLMKELVSLAAGYGMENTITITGTFSYGASSSVASTVLTILDITTVETRSSGDLQLVKSTYIDAACANPASPTYVTTIQAAQSGNCIKYQIQATNTGATALSGLSLNDTAPPYTTLQSGTPASSVGASCTGLAPGTITVTGAAAQASFTGTMPSGCVATFVYEVKLN
jgi:parallel beta-helix repeat protein